MSYAISAVVIAAFMLILFPGTEKVKTQGKQELLGRYNMLRGIFALEIIVGHVIRFERTPLYLLGKVMIISVAFFLFVSGWGITISYHTKKNYLDGFLGKKCGYLFILAVITYAFRWVVTYFILHTNMIDKNLLYDFIQKTNWYIWELILFYAIFWVVYKYIKRGRVLTIMGITSALIVFFFKQNMLQGYYSSGLAFPLGILFGEHYEKMAKWLNSWKGVVVTVLLSLLGTSSLLLDENSLLGMVFLRNIMCIAALFVLFYILSNISFSNRALNWCSGISTELYLFQFVWLNVYGALLKDWKIKLGLVVISTLGTAIVMHWVLKPVKKFFAVHAGK